MCDPATAPPTRSTFHLDGPIPTGDYSTLDLRGGVRSWRGIELRVGVLNVTDEYYADHLNAKNPFTGVPVAEPGRVLFLDAVSAF